MDVIRNSQQANEIRNFISETGRLSTTVVNSSVNQTLQHDDFLAHYGIKKQQWGNRRYQYADGSLTPLGRIHYGVGAARKGVAKAASSTSNAAKKVKPTDEELLEKYNKAKSKQARRELKQEIRDMSSFNRTKDSLKQKKAEKEERKKKYEKMSDQDVIDMINRYKNEAALKALARDSKKSPLRVAIDDAARNAIARAAGTTLQNVLTNVGQNIVDEFDTPSNKLRREAQMIENKEKIDKAKKGPSILDELQEAYDAAKRSRDTYETQLQEAALRGNEEAKQRLSDYKNAVKGSHKSAKDDPSYVDLDQDVKSTYESSKKTSKRQNEDVSDVIRNAATKEYEEAVTDVDVEYVDDYIKTSSTKKFRLLPFRR